MSHFKRIYCELLCPSSERDVHDWMTVKQLWATEINLILIHYLLRYNDIIVVL